MTNPNGSFNGSRWMPPEDADVSEDQELSAQLRQQVRTDISSGSEGTHRQLETLLQQAA